MLGSSPWPQDERGLETGRPGRQAMGRVGADQGFAQACAARVGEAEAHSVGDSVGVGRAGVGLPVQVG